MANDSGGSGFNAGDFGQGVGGLIGGIAVLAGAGGKGGDRYYRQALETWQKLKDPNYDWREIPPAELRIFAKYFPEQYQAIVPEEAKLVVESPELRLSELRSLKRLEDQSVNGLPLSELLSGQEAGRKIAREAGRQQEGAIQDVAARGRLGTADELSARLSADQNMAELERALGSDLAQQGIQARQSGLAGATQLASGIRGEDYRANAANADIMNELARYISQTKTEENQRNAAARQAAANANADLTQRIGETNALNQYGAANENLNRKNQLISALSSFQLAKTRGLSDALTGRGTAADQAKAARDWTIMQMGQQGGKAAGNLGSLAFQ